MPGPEQEVGLASGERASVATLGKVARRVFTEVKKRRVLAGIAALVVFLSAVLASIGVIDQLGRNEANPGSLYIEAFKPDAGTVYLLPFDAPLEEYSGEYSDICSAAQLRWLSSHGAARTTVFGIRVRSDAEEGAQLTLDNLHADGKTVRQSEPMIQVTCATAGGGDYVRVELDTDTHGPAMVRKSGEETLQPFVFNLAPGEAGSIEIRTAGRQGFKGRLSMDATVGGRTRAYSVPSSKSGNLEFDIPGVGVSTGFHFEPTKTPGEFHCMNRSIRPKESDLVETPCNATDIRLRIATAWGREDLVRKLTDLKRKEVPGRRTGAVGFRHPSWGQSTLVTSHLDDTRASWITVLDANGVKRWSRQWSWSEIQMNEPSTDKTGNLFVTFNPGRYDGVIALRPTVGGFEDFGTLPEPDSFAGSRFGYWAKTVDQDGDGTLEIIQFDNDCNPSCAEGTESREVYRWTGSDYEAR